MRLTAQQGEDAGASELASVKLVDAWTPKGIPVAADGIIWRQVAVNGDRSAKISRTPLEHAAIQAFTTETLRVKCTLRQLGVLSYPECLI